MKYLVFIVSAFVVCGSLTAAPYAEEDLADKVQTVVNEILSIIPESIALKDDVIDIPENDLENGKITIGEISLTGLKALNTKLTFDSSSSRLDYTFNWRDIALVFDVTTEAKGLVSIDHHLSVKVKVRGLKDEGHAIVSEDAKEVTDIFLAMSVGEVDFVIKGLLNNDDLSQKISAFLTQNVVTFINGISPLIAPYASKVVKDIINVALKIES